MINLWVSQKVFNDNILQTVAQVMQQRIGVVPSGKSYNDLFLFSSLQPNFLLLFGPHPDLFTLYEF